MTQQEAKWMGVIILDKQHQMLLEMLRTQILTSPPPFAKNEATRLTPLFGYLLLSVAHCPIPA